MPIGHGQVSYVGPTKSTFINLHYLGGISYYIRSQNIYGKGKEREKTGLPPTEKVLMAIGDGLNKALFLVGPTNFAVVKGPNGKRRGKKEKRRRRHSVVKRHLDGHWPRLHAKALYGGTHLLYIRGIEGLVQTLHLQSCGRFTLLWDSLY